MRWLPVFAILSFVGCGGGDPSASPTECPPGAPTQGSCPRDGLVCGYTALCAGTSYPYEVRCVARTVPSGPPAAPTTRTELSWEGGFACDEGWLRDAGGE